MLSGFVSTKREPCLLKSTANSKPEHSTITELSLNLKQYCVSGWGVIGSSRCCNTKERNRVRSTLQHCLLQMSWRMNCALHSISLDTQIHILTCWYQRRHIMLIFLIIFLFWVANRIGLQAKMLKKHISSLKLSSAAAFHPLSLWNTRF